MGTRDIWNERSYQVGEKKAGKQKQTVVQFNKYKHKLKNLRNCKTL